MADIPPVEYRDFSRGVVRKSAVAQSLIPLNSVSHAVNVDFDTTVGSMTVRSGTTLLGSAVASGKTPLGLFEFVTGGSVINDLAAVFTGASTASIYYYDSSWHTSGITNLSNTAKCRFTQLGNQAFIVNGVVMKSSVDLNTWGTTNCITTNSVLPSLIFRSKSRLLASGDATTGAGHSKSRIYFSSIVDPSTSPGGITWSTDPSTGDWIDVNPDDGSDITGFAETSGLVLVFKDKAMYRLDAINKTIDTDNVFPFGAVSQEAIVNCQGVVYFFTGQDIRRTNGSFPEKISRLIQDWVSAIPQSSWTSVVAGTDGVNVTFSIGSVTVPATGDGKTTYSNVVLKFSTQDENWTVRFYAQNFTRFCQFTTSAGRTFIGADASGNVQTLDSGSTDNGTAIKYEINTQELDFGNRSHTKSITGGLAVFMKNGIDSQLFVKAGDGDFKQIEIDLSKRVNYVKSFDAKAKYLTFSITGESSGAPPTIEGFSFEKIQDLGFIESDESI